MKPFLLVLQFSPHDARHAWALARTLADIGAPQHDILFYARHDTNHDPETIEYCRPRFAKVLSETSKTRMNGWPIGPNAMVVDLWALSHHRHGTGEWDYEAIMLLEADCVPLSLSWLEEIIAEWREGKQLVLGHWIGQKNDAQQSHINGNLVFSPRLTFTFGALLTRYIPTSAWDVYFWKAYHRAARASKTIFSDYRANFTTCANLFKEREHPKGTPFAGELTKPVWLHGHKDEHALRCVRGKLGLQT